MPIGAARRQGVGDLLRRTTARSPGDLVIVTEQRQPALAECDRAAAQHGVRSPLLLTATLEK
ncbi:hypothetical protein ACPZ19_48750 [Amycolatopsis lurida]